jgi:hypothetical protein
LKILLPVIIGFILGLIGNIALEKMKQTKTRAEKRLMELYSPAEFISDSMQIKYGAHQFTDLTKEEQNEFITTVNKGIVYAESFLYYTFAELKMHYQDGDPEQMNILYGQIRDLISKDFFQLREQLGLPNIDYDQYMRSITNNA